MSRLDKDVLRIALYILLVLLLVLMVATTYLVYAGITEHRAKALRDSFRMADYIEVTAVQIKDTVEGEPIHMEVARTISQSFPGFYEVYIRHADNGQIICQTGQVDVNYKAFQEDGSATRLPHPLTLDWWAEGGTCDALLQLGLRAGQYSVETCHGHREAPGFKTRVKECWRPVAVFTVHPRHKRNI